jgi:Amt family ammonium transporter
MSSLYAVPYNGTGATGGDSLTENLNIYYEVTIPLL